MPKRRSIAVRWNGTLLVSIWLVALADVCSAAVRPSGWDRHWTADLAGRSSANQQRVLPSRFEEPGADLGRELMALLSAAAPSTVRLEIIPVYIDCFDDSSEWTRVDGMTIEEVSEYDGQKAYLCGSKRFSSILATKLPASGSYNYSYMMKTFSEPKDLRNCNIACRLKMPEGSGMSHISHIHKVTLRLFDLDGTCVDYNLSWGQGCGWKEAILPQGDFVSASGDIDWSRIGSVAVLLYTKANATPSILLDRLMFFQDSVGATAPHVPIVINTFDDGLREQYDAAAYLSGKGMVGTFYIIGRTVDAAWPTCLSVDALMDMQYAGHLIGNHTWDHLMPFDGLTQEEQTEQITTMTRWMCLHGFGEGARILATPGNAWNPGMDRYLRPYYDQVRQVLSGGGAHRNPLYDRRRLRVTASSPSEAMTQVQKAIADSNWSAVVYMGHEMHHELLEEFKQYVDYLFEELRAGRIRVCLPVHLRSL